MNNIHPITVAPKQRTESYRKHSITLTYITETKEWQWETEHSHTVRFRGRGRTMTLALNEAKRTIDKVEMPK